MKTGILTSKACHKSEVPALLFSGEQVSYTEWVTVPVGQGLHQGNKRMPTEWISVRVGQGLRQGNRRIPNFLLSG